MKLVLVALSLVFAFAFASVDFNDWKKTHDKNYQGTEKSEEEAKAAFNKTVAAIKKHNADPSATYKQGLNENADMTEEERHKRNGYKHNRTHSKNVKAFKPNVKASSSTDYPTNFNVTSWMGPVKNQGICGCDYVMATLSMIDGLSNEDSTAAIIFSDQQVLDCDTEDDACNGGSPFGVLDFANSTGLVLDSDYASLSNRLRRDTCKKKAPIAWMIDFYFYFDLTQIDLENDLKELVYDCGPVTVTMDANDAAFSYYMSGVYVPAAGKCSSSIDKANQVVVVTGYGTDKKTKLDYWIVRNSWGKTWGMNGYALMVRGINACGIGSQAWVPF